MPSEPVHLECSRCGRKAPPVDSPEFHEWGPADLAPEELLDAIAVNLLLCLECREEAKREDELGGEGG